MDEQQLFFILAYKKPWESLPVGSKINDQETPNLFLHVGKSNVQGWVGRGLLSSQLGQHSDSCPA